MHQGKSLTKNKSRIRTKQIGSITLRTSDKKIDLDERWVYLDQMLEVCEYMGVEDVWLRSDKFRAHAGRVSITVQPPKNAETLMTIAHEAAHVGFDHVRLHMDRHRMEFETGTFEMQFMAYCKIPVPKKEQDRCKPYVAMLIGRAIKRNGKRFDREAWEYSGFRHDPIPELVYKGFNNGYREAMERFSPGLPLPFPSPPRPPIADGRGTP